MPARAVEDQDDLLRGSGSCLARECGEFGLEEGDADTCRQMDERAARRRTRAGLLTAAEAAAALGVGRKRVLEWARCGLIQGVWKSEDGKRMLQFFTQTEVARFSQRYVLPEDAAVILGVAAHAMIRFVARGKLESVQNSDAGKRGCHLFRRADVLALGATRRRRSEQTLRKVLAAELSTSSRG